MKTGTALADILFLICSISFYLLIIAFGFALATEAFTDDGKMGNFSPKFNSALGYEMPVEFKIKPKSPMFNNILFTDYKEGIDDKGKKTYATIPQYANSITTEDSLNFKAVVSINNYGMGDNFELTSNVFRGDGHVHIKPKTLFNKVIIVFRTYMNFIILIIIFFFLKNIFKMLRITIEFSQKLYKLIQMLGVIMISKVLLSVIINSILGMWLTDIGIQPLNDGLNYVDITMSSRLDFDFSLFLVGFSLIVLSALLKSGSKMQQENKLTI
ncbi:DUF2975 domain-containing protein [Psychroserpens luteolus]|uniref:DUF2975 domain-containing protein n=1 Tax=Psychroserpens luteolus TaxID=2855840 RepID=UPI001E37BC3C|nr:DUF2975 domain-containing protein [Psychroserpens luteolus]MCD2258005.1 DUF2975 domain-containing protein [Psychroserpens luteolus]